MKLVQLPHNEFFEGKYSFYAALYLPMKYEICRFKTIGPKQAC